MQDFSKHNRRARLDAIGRQALLITKAMDAEIARSNAGQVKDVAAMDARIDKLMAAVSGLATTVADLSRAAF